MMSRRILAFYSPYPGAGKSTAGRWAARRMGAREISFAIPLRNAVGDMIMYPVYSPYPLFFSPEDKEKVIPHLGVTWREMMIAFGQAGRQLHPDLWVRMLERRLKAENVDFVVSDLRFPNEYDLMRRFGARIVRIENPGREIVTRETEGLLEGYRFDAVISNLKKSLKAYCYAIDEMLGAFWPDLMEEKWQRQRKG